MNATDAPKCRCGLTLEPSGCAHCDTPGPIPCREFCPRCEERDLHCNVCSVRCGTKTQAQLHERDCRKREIEQARRSA